MPTVMVIAMRSSISEKPRWQLEAALYAFRSQDGQRDISRNRIGDLPCADIGSLCGDGVIDVTSGLHISSVSGAVLNSSSLSFSKNAAVVRWAHLDIHAGRVREHQRHRKDQTRVLPW